MIEEEKKQLMENYYEGLELLDEVLDSLLIEDNLKEDEKLLNMKKDVKENMFKLDSMLGVSSDSNN